jgi:hypothetical protein
MAATVALCDHGWGEDGTPAEGERLLDSVVA